MANPYYVAPLGGLQNYASIGQTVSKGIGDYKQNQQRQQLQQEAQRLMREGTPQEIAAFSAANPQIGQAMQQGSRFVSEATERNAKEGAQQIIAGADPVQVLQNRVEVIQSQGGDPSDTLQDLERAKQNPEAYRDYIGRIYSMRFPKEYEAFRAATGAGGGPDIGQYNPRDYTTESFARFVETGDPSVLERYAAQRNVEIGGVPHVFDPAIGGYRPAGVAGATGSQPVTTETVAQSEAEIAGERTRAQTQAQQDVASGSPQERRRQAEAQRESEQNIANFEGIATQADSLLANQDYIDAMAGISGKAPAIPGTDRYDAQVAFNQFKDTLTLGNLDKMSGVLTDRDIQVLSSAAGGIEAGMSESALRERLQTIRDVFAEKTESERKKLRSLMTGGEGAKQSGQGEQQETVNWSDL